MFSPSIQNYVILWRQLSNNASYTHFLPEDSDLVSYHPVVLTVETSKEVGLKTNTAYTELSKGFC